MRRDLLLVQGRGDRIQQPGIVGTKIASSSAASRARASRAARASRSRQPGAPGSMSTRRCASEAPLSNSASRAVRATSSARGSDPDRRHAADGRAESDQRGVAALGRAVRRAVDRDAHRLADLLAGLRRMREAGSERCGIGLERGVAPVALILDLEQGPFELERDPHAVGHFDIQAVEGREQRRGERPRRCAAARSRPEACPRAGPPVCGRGSGDRRSRRGADHQPMRLNSIAALAVPSKLSVRLPFAAPASSPRQEKSTPRCGIGAVGVEAQREAALAGIEADAAELRCDRSPVAVAHRCVQAAHDLDLAEAHVARDPGLQFGDERARATLRRSAGGSSRPYHR